jgi:hypothetical protein
LRPFNGLNNVVKLQGEQQDSAQKDAVVPKVVELIRKKKVVELTVPNYML